MKRKTGIICSSFAPVSTPERIPFRFVELHFRDGRECVINIDSIVAVEVDANGHSGIVLKHRTDSRVLIKEDVHTIVNRIREASK